MLEKPVSPEFLPKYVRVPGPDGEGRRQEEWSRSNIVFLDPLNLVWIAVSQLTSDVTG